MSGDASSALAAYFVGYAAVLATPGPNMLAVGALAALRGVRAALPFALGLGAGAGALCGVLLALASVLPDTAAWSAVGHVVGACLLAAIAGRILRGQSLTIESGGPRSGMPADVTAGFVTAASNPITGLYFAAQFVGPVGDFQGFAAVALPLATGALAIAHAALVAALLSHVAVRRRVARSFRIWSLVAASLFAGLAMLQLRPVVVALFGW